MQIELDNENLKRGESEKLSSREISDILEKEKEKRLFAAIQSSGHKLSPLLVDHLRAMRLIGAAVSKAMEELKECRDQIRKDIQRESTIRSRCSVWLQDRVEERVRKQRETFDALPSKLVKMLEDEGLHVYAYLLSRNLEWKRDKLEQVRQELAGVLVPSYSVELIRYYWSPHSWEVDFSGAKYFAKRYTTITISSGYPCWRLLLMAARMYTWTSNAAIGCIDRLWCSNYSLRALVLPSPFYPYQQMDVDTGKLRTDTSTKVDTYISRLVSLWSEVMKSRKKFESQPDSGFLGKGLTRLFNILWNYVVVGAGGSVLLTTFYPTAIIANCLLSLCLLLTAPVWAPIGVILSYLVTIFVYDFDTGNPGSLLSCIGHVLLGVGEMLYGVVGVGIVAPIISCLFTAVLVVYFQLGNFFDAAIFHIVLSRLARVPDCSGFLTRQISGPGLRSFYRYQVEPELVVLSVHSHLEQLELDWYSAWVTAQIDIPATRAQNILNQYFKSLGELRSNSLNKFLSKSAEDHRRQLHQLTQHQQEVRVVKPVSNVAVGKQIRQDPRTLKSTIAMTTAMVERFHQERLFKYLDVANIGQFWVTHNLQDGNWEGLARSLLEKVMGRDFLIPLEMEGVEEDEHNREELVLQVHHVDAASYCNMILGGKSHDPLDEVTTKTKVTKRVMNPSPWQRCLSGLTSFIPNSVLVMWKGSVVSYASYFDISALYSHNSVDVVQIVATSPVLDGHGLRFAVSVRQPTNFWYTDPTLNVEGGELFDALEKIAGSTMMSLGRMFLPLPVDSMLTIVHTKNALRAQGQSHYSLTIGTGSPGPYSRVKFRPVTVTNMLKKLVNEHNDPSFEVVVRVGDSSIGPTDLFRISTTPSELLEHLEGRSATLRIAKEKDKKD